MTEERIKELARQASNSIGLLYDSSIEAIAVYLRTVAAEAREEGIEAAVEIALPCLIESENIKKIFTLEIKQLKEKVYE